MQLPLQPHLPFLMSPYLVIPYRTAHLYAAVARAYLKRSGAVPCVCSAALPLRYTRLA